MAFANPIVEINTMKKLKLVNASNVIPRVLNAQDQMPLIVFHAM
jgi:hypothetical protein